MTLTRWGEMGRHPYEKIVNGLLAQIREGTLGPGDAVPSESALAGEYGVSRVTARGALARLVSSGVIDSEPRRGYVVRSYDREAVPLMVGGDEQRVSVDAVDVPPVLAKVLPGGPVIRRRAVGGGLRDSYYAPGVVELVPALGWPMPLAEPDTALLERAGGPVGDPVLEVYARMPTPEETALLGLPPAGTPVIEQVTLLHDQAGRVMVARVMTLPGDRHFLRFGVHK